MIFNLTNAQRRALRQAAQLAHERDTSRNREDRDVFWLEAGSDDLPIILGGAIEDGILSLDDVGETARAIVGEMAARIAAARSEFAQRQSEPQPVEDPFDPQAIVSLSAVVAEIEFLGNDGTLYVNCETGEVLARTDLMEGDDETLEALEEDPAWVAVLSSFDLHDMETMRRYTNRIAGPAASKELSEALHGRGAYRRFRDVIRRRGLQDEWNEYREKKHEESVRFHLKQHGIRFRK